MAEWRNIVAKIKTLLEGVSGIGRVYDKPINLRTLKELRDVASVYDSVRGEHIINCWIIERVSARDERGGTRVEVPIQQAIREETYRISGVYSYYDNGDSAVKFHDLIDAIMAKFLPEVSFGDADKVAGPLVARNIGYRTFGEIVCHSVDFELQVTYRQPSVTYT